MAGDWIKMRIGIADDPAVISMAATLGLEEDTIVGKLHRLWSWADRQTVTGLIPGTNTNWIDRHVSCPGFANAMISVGWLRSRTDGIEFPNFERLNGESSKKRESAAIRQRRSRAKRAGSAASEVRADDEPDEMSHQKRDKSVTEALPEESREEKECVCIALPDKKNNTHSGGGGLGAGVLSQPECDKSVTEAQPPLESASGNGQPSPQEAAKLAEGFYRLWDSKAPLPSLSGADLGPAAALLREHGPIRARALVIQLVKATRKEWPECKSLGGAVLKYLPEALKLLKAEEYRAKEVQRKESKRLEDIQAAEEQARLLVRQKARWESLTDEQRQAVRGIVAARLLRDTGRSADQVAPKVVYSVCLRVAEETHGLLPIEATEKA